MWQITLFLVLAVLALAIGNVLLHLTKSKKVSLHPPLMVDKNMTGNFYKDYNSNERIGKQIVGESKILYTELQTLQSHFRALEEMNKMAHNRISDLETDIKTMRKSKINDASEAVFVSEIGTKLRKLENFKSNTQVEMVAIKEIIFEMKDFLEKQDKS